MAPIPNMDIIKQNDKYAQGKRIYAHKKFGACVSSTPPKKASKIKASSKANEKTLKESVEQTSTSTTTKRSTADIFRPYALPDKTPRKRKHHELQSEQNSQKNEMELKRFAYTTLSTPSIPASPAFSTTNNTYFTNPATMIFNPLYRLQQYQFNPQTFAIILQKQRAALCMGEILKRQGNLNSYNLMG